MYFSGIIHPPINHPYPMPIPYDLVRRPGKEAPEERPYFPRFVSQGTVHLDDLMADVESKCDRPTMPLPL